MLFGKFFHFSMILDILDFNIFALTHSVLVYFFSVTAFSSYTDAIFYWIFLFVNADILFHKTFDLILPHVLFCYLLSWICDTNLKFEMLRYTSVTVPTSCDFLFSASLGHLGTILDSKPSLSVSYLTLLSCQELIRIMILF